MLATPKSKPRTFFILIFLLYLQQFEAIHNKDYSVVKTFKAGCKARFTFCLEVLFSPIKLAIFQPGTKSFSACSADPRRQQTQKRSYLTLPPGQRTGGGHAIGYFCALPIGCHVCDRIFRLQGGTARLAKEVGAEGSPEGARSAGSWATGGDGRCSPAMTGRTWP